MEFIPNINLSDYSTLHVGGTAKGIYLIQSDEDIAKVFGEIEQSGAHPSLIGAGSNTYFGDGPHDNLVLVRIAIKGVDIKSSVIEGKIITVGAGEDWDAFVVRAAKEKLWGLESLAGIPGTVGAAPIQNIGAYGREASDTIEAVEVYNRETKTIEGIPGRLCGFGYRTSIFNTSARDKYIILRVRFWLHAKRRHVLPKEVVVPPSGSITPGEVGEQIRKIRAMKLPDYHEFPNCGSFFKNPIIKNEDALRLRQKYPDMPQFPVGAEVKLPAAWLIECAGLKGKDWGNVVLSPKHALVLTTNKKASAKELVSAMSEIQKVIRDKFDIVLSPEPNFVL